MKLLDIVNAPVVRLDSSNRKSLNCVSILSNGKCTIGVNSLNCIGACSSWLKFIWLVGKLEDFLSWLVVIGEALSIICNEPLINELLPPLLNKQPIRYHGESRIMSHPKVREPGEALMPPCIAVRVANMQLANAESTS